MAYFAYKARNSSGELVAGVLESADSDGAAAQLRLSESAVDLLADSIEHGRPYKAEAVILVGIYDDYTEVARDALVWTVGSGRVFYFRPGHETYPIYLMPEVKKVIENGVRWLAKRT